MAIANKLVAWYGKVCKPLPWREEPTPYRNWVAEVMSQQTTLKVVVPRFELFVRELPDLKALATCDDERLGRLWSGLGYYARARNLRAGARWILERFPGRWPASRQEWLTVPGCGPYTAAVLASICSGEPVPSVDGNAIRVVSRLEGMEDDVWSAAGQQRVGRFLSEEIANHPRPGDFNQAVMELGQEICLKAHPACDRCPIRQACRALAMDAVDRCPPPKPRKKTKEVELAVLIISRPGGAEIALGKRRAGFLEGTTGFPILDLGKETSRTTLEQLDSIAESGLSRSNSRPRHTITRHRIRLAVYGAKVVDLKEIEPLLDISLRWIEKRNAIEGLTTALDSKSLSAMIGNR